MYIALKWLIGLDLTMWIALCSLDIYWKKSLSKPLDYSLQDIFTPFHNNESFQVQVNSYVLEKIKIPDEYSHDSIYFQYILLLAGICMVAMLNRKNEIIVFTRRKVINFNFDMMKQFLRKVIFLKKTAKILNAAILKYLKIMYMFFLKINHHDNNLILFNKFEKISQERRNLSQRVNMRMQYRFVTEVKNKFVHNEAHERQIIENRVHNISYQQLYLVTHQENIVLKSRLKKLTKEKEETERKLLKLINQVCQSKNNDLKAYCSQLIVYTKNNLLYSDVKAEIDKFLRNSSDILHFQAKAQFPEQTIQHVNSDSLFIKPSEIVASANLIPERDNAPFRGPSEKCVWTVKDKDGIIEKLYEYGSDFDNGDMVRRIRQYSVYYDTECLFDFSNSTTFINNQDADISNKQNFANIKVTVTNRKFLSNSQAFKNFLQNNKSIMTQGSRSSNSTALLST